MAAPAASKEPGESAEKDKVAPLAAEEKAGGEAAEAAGAVVKAVDKEPVEKSLPQAA